MKNKYQPQQFEKKWIEQWEKEKTNQTRDSRLKTHDSQRKMYVLDMFPYPSGAGLHVGHPRGYTATDILSRYYRMSGYSVLHPMGWDAFGLPAENAAIKAKKNPMDMVPENIANFKRQMKMLGLSYDWEKEFATTDPTYYKWTQWLFIQFFKLGLLYKKNTPVYYCEFCKTGLAEEEVLPSGLHERCGNPITRKELPQWIFRITTYAERLLEDLVGLQWPGGIVEMQRNWIGKSEGADVEFVLDGYNLSITVFTTRPDTLFGVTALVLAPEHEITKKILNKEIKVDDNYYKKIQKYAEEASKKIDLQRTDLAKEKTGVFTGLYIINPVNNEKVPLWVADYVLGYYGHGAVMVVPAHDERDFEFARKYNLEFRQVISPSKEHKLTKECYTAVGYVIPSEQIKSFLKEPEYFNKPVGSQEFKKKAIEELEKRKLGKKITQYKLRDWIFSRQRYWGEPTPMIFCPSCAQKKITWWDLEAGKTFLKDTQNISKVNKEIQENLYGWFPVDEKSLPLELPYLKSYEPPATGESPLSTVKDWVEAKCPNCGGKARRETDTMPNWAGSCWYFLAFPVWDKYKKDLSMEFFSLETRDSRRETQNELQKWLAVDWYFGGAEHAVLHLLYSRFWVKAMYDLKIINFKEPFLRLRNVGMIIAEDHRKMSKSFGNVINPDDVVKEYGADALRVYEMFMAPFSQEISWSTRTLQGTYRFLRRVWDLVHHSVIASEAKQSQGIATSPAKLGPRNDNKEDNKLVQKLNKTIKKVGDDILEIKFNTAIAAMMEFLNEWEDASHESRDVRHETKDSRPKTHDGISLSRENIKKFLQILAPFAPFITEELWQEVLGEKTSIHLSVWPKVEKELLIEDEVKIPVQVNGKVRGFITVPADKLDQTEVEKQALADEKVKKYLAGKDYKSIYVKGKILNFVIKD